jgi:hypothetical protein
LGGNITLDIQPGNVVLLFQLELVCLLHGQRSPSVIVGVGTHLKGRALFDFPSSEPFGPHGRLQFFR